MSSQEIQGDTFDKVVMKVLFGVEKFATPMSCIVLESGSFFMCLGQKTDTRSTRCLRGLVEPHTRYGGGIELLVLCFAKMVAFLSL